MSLVHVVDLRLARRGGVAIGDIYHDDEAVFGPGLVRAYDIESNVAKFPRIVVDQEVLDTCGPISGFNVFEDGLHFLDPFTTDFIRFHAGRRGRMRRVANRDCRNFFGARFGVVCHDGS